MWVTGQLQEEEKKRQNEDEDYFAVGEVTFDQLSKSQHVWNCWTGNKGKESIRNRVKNALVWLQNFDNSQRFEWERKAAIRYNLETFAMMYDICFDFGFDFVFSVQAWMYLWGCANRYLRWFKCPIAVVVVSCGASGGCGMCGICRYDSDWGCSVRLFSIFATDCSSMIIILCRFNLFLPRLITSYLFFRYLLLLLPLLCIILLLLPKSSLIINET